MIANLALLPIFGYATLFYIYMKRSVSVSIFFSISSIITVLFMFGIFDFLRLSTYILFYGGIVLLILMGVLFTDRLRKAIKSVPFVMYTSASLIYLYLMQDAQLFFWDEYSHWGAAIKEMFYFHEFYNTTSIVTALHYPPGMATWEYFIVLITGFNEGSLYFAYFLILFSATLMMYEKLSFKELHWIVLIFIIQMVIFSGFGHWFSCIYIDHIVGIMFLGLILSFLVDEFLEKELLLFIFPLSALVLFKEIGLYFGVATVGIMALIILFRAYSLKQKSLWIIVKENKKSLFILLFLLISSVAILKGWGIRQSSVGVGEHSQSMSKIVKTIFSSDSSVLKEDTEIEVKKRFWEVVVSQQLHKEKVSLNYNEFSYGLMPKYTKKIKLTTVGSFIFFIFLFTLVYISSNKYQKKEGLLIGSYLFLIGIVYLFILYFSFLVAFGEGALRIPSYVRYMNIAILPLFFIAFALMLPMYQRKIELTVQQSLKLFSVVLFSIVLLLVITQPYLKPLYSQLQNGFRVNADSITKNILQKVPPKSTIFVVFPIRNNGSLNNILRYSLIPSRATISSINFYQKPFGEMLNIYKKYDYVWFSSLNQEILDKNRKILKSKNKKNIFTLYKVKLEDSKITLNPII